MLALFMATSFVSAQRTGIEVRWDFPDLNGVVASDGDHVDATAINRIASQLEPFGIKVLVLITDGDVGDSIREAENYLEAALDYYNLRAEPAYFVVFIGTRRMPESNNLRPLYLDYGPNLAGILRGPESESTEADRIREEVMIPRLLEGDFDGAVLGALQALSVALEDPRSDPDHPVVQDITGCEPTTGELEGDAPPTTHAERLLARGETEAAEAFLTRRLRDDPDNPETRFALGSVQAMIAIEHLTQDAYRHGLGTGSAGEVGMMFGVDVPANFTPEPVSYSDLRTSLQRFQEKLDQAEATLAPLADLAGTDAGTNLRMRLDLGLIRLDFNGDGVPGDQLSAVLFELRNLAEFDPQGEPCQPIPIDFDLGDSLWLRAYLNLISGFVDTILAYDAQTLWDATAQLFFATADTPYPYLNQPVDPNFEGFDLAPIADAVAIIHLLNLPVAEPQRMSSALEHFEATVELSRASWEAFLAETDDEREWLPNPRQTGVVPSRPGGPPMAVTDIMIDNWLELLDETEAILQGRKLLPYWRVTDGRGVNLKHVFTEPQAFDLILWLQGVAVEPYLEEGELTRGETWQRIVQAFGGRFTPFAFWFN